MEALNVNKFGRTFRTGTQEAQAHCEELFFFKKNLYPNVQLVKRDIVTAVTYFYITTEFHYVKHGSAYGSVMYGEKTLIEILAEILIFL